MEDLLLSKRAKGTALSLVDMQNRKNTAVSIISAHEEASEIVREERKKRRKESYSLSVYTNAQNPVRTFWNDKQIIVSHCVAKLS